MEEKGIRKRKFFVIFFFYFLSQLSLKNALPNPIFCDKSSNLVTLNSKCIFLKTTLLGPRLLLGEILGLTSPLGRISRLLFNIFPLPPKQSERLQLYCGMAECYYPQKRRCLARSLTLLNMLL